MSLLRHAAKNHRLRVVEFCGWPRSTPGSATGPPARPYLAHMLSYSLTLPIKIHVCAVGRLAAGRSKAQLECWGTVAKERHRPSTAVPGAIAAAPISATKALGPAWPSSLSRRLQWKHLAGFCRGPAKETGARPQPGTSVFTHRNGLKQRSAHGGCFMSLEAEDIGRRFRHQPMSS